MSRAERVLSGGLGNAQDGVGNRQGLCPSEPFSSRVAWRVSERALWGRWRQLDEIRGQQLLIGP
jgi:hypothetical protein